MSENLYNLVCEYLSSNIKTDDIANKTILSNDNERYTVTIGKKGITIKKETNFIELDLEEFLDYDLWLSYDEIYSLIDGDKKLEDERLIEIMIESAKEYFFNDCYGQYLSGDESYFKPTEANKKLEKLTKNELKPTSIFKIKKEYNKKTVTGVCIDLATNNDFMNVYENGIEIEMPKSEEIYQKTQELRRKDELGSYDPEEDEIYEEEIGDEIEQLIRQSLDLMNGTAEFRLKGIYVILNNQLHYLTKEELDKVYENVIDYPTLRTIQELLESESGFDKLLEKIKSLLSDDSRKIIDIMNIEETGKTLEEILCDLIMNNIDNDYILTEKSKVKQKSISRLINKTY